MRISQRYLIFQPRKVAVLARTMKESLRKKLSLPYDISILPNHLEYLCHQIENLINEPQVTIHDIYGVP